MKQNLTALSKRYVTALRRHLKQRSGADLVRARELGRQAVAIGLETLDLARIHEGAVATLKTSRVNDAAIKETVIFFTEAIAPIEKTHQAALKTNARLNQLNKTLSRRMVHLAASHRSLKRGINGRKRVEQALRKSGKHSQKILAESRQLSLQLQSLTHRILSAQEDKRKKISTELRDEIAQILLGINVRLLTLKKESVVNGGRLKKDIASTQRLVDKSVTSITRFVNKFGPLNEK